MFYLYGKILLFYIRFQVFEYSHIFVLIDYNIYIDKILFFWILNIWVEIKWIQIIKLGDKID